MSMAAINTTDEPIEILIGGKSDALDYLNIEDLEAEASQQVRYSLHKMLLWIILFSSMMYLVYSFFFERDSTLGDKEKEE